MKSLLAALALTSAVGAPTDQIPESSVLTIHKGFESQWSVCIGKNMKGEETVKLPDGQVIKIYPGQRWSTEDGLGECKCDAAEPEPTVSPAFYDLPESADNAYALEFEIRDTKEMHKAQLARTAKHHADVKIIIDGKTAEMSFSQFKHRMFGSL